MHLNGEKWEMSFNGRKLARMSKWTKSYAYDNILGLGGCLPLPQGYIHVYDQNIQTSSSLKPRGQSKLLTLCRASLVRVNESLHK